MQEFPAPITPHDPLKEIREIQSEQTALLKELTRTMGQMVHMQHDLIELVGVQQKMLRDLQER